MRQTGAVVVPFAVEKDLGLAIESSERGSVDNSVPVTLIAGTKGMLSLRVQTTSALGGSLRIGSEE